MLMRVGGGCFAYGGLAAFVCLVVTQLYRWFRDGEWTHVGVADGLRVLLSRCCVGEGDVGGLASLVHWLEAPVAWLGLHTILEVVPASIGLFFVSVLGNFLFIRGGDLLAALERGDSNATP